MHRTNRLYRTVR